MLAKLGTALVAAIILGLLGAPRALAEKDYELLEPYGGPTQSWQDIEKSRQNIQRQIQRLYHGGGAEDTYRPAISVNHKRRPHGARHEPQVGAQ